MSSINVANTDWEIIDDIADALTDVRVSGVAVFNTISVTTSEGQAQDFQMTGSTGKYPLAIILYTGTEEDHSPEDVRGCFVSVEITIATKVAPEKNEAARTQEVLRLINAVKNAIEIDPPANAHAWGDSNYYKDKLEWGVPELNTGEPSHWASAMIPLDISYTIDLPTLH